MSTFPPSPARQTAHAALYKMPSPTVRCDETWKDRYRFHCKQQFKRARDKMVNKMRQLSVNSSRRYFLHSFIRSSLMIINRLSLLVISSKMNGLKCLVHYHQRATWISMVIV